MIDKIPVSDFISLILLKNSCNRKFIYIGGKIHHTRTPRGAFSWLFMIKTRRNDEGKFHVRTVNDNNCITKDEAVYCTLPSRI